MKHLVSYFVSCTNSIKVVFIIGCYIYYTTFRIFQKKIILLCTISQKEVEGSGSIMEYSLIQDKLRIVYDIEISWQFVSSFQFFASLYVKHSLSQYSDEFPGGK